MLDARVEFRLVGEKLPLDVVPASFDAREALSRPYEIDVTFTTTDATFDPAALLRTSVTLVVVDTARGRERTSSGVCDRCELVHHDGTHFLFRARLVPPIAALAAREDCRIHQDATILDVVKTVLAAAGVDRVQIRVGASYPPRAYVVQYRESELAFVHRLLEDEGLFYFFEHEAGEVTMVISDALEAVASEVTVPVVLTMSAGIPGTDSIADVALTRRLRTTSVALRDYDLERPKTFPTASQAAAAAVPMPYYEYPGGFTEGPDGQRRAAARLRELRADAEVLRGSSTATTLEVGKLFTLAGAHQDGLDGQYVVTQLTTRGRQSRSGGGDDGTSTVENELVAIPAGRAWAPRRVTPRPRIRGLQTAVVTGPTMGEEDIHCDRYGRVKVRFHWDRVGQFDDRSSCWVRVLQVPLGGSMIIPRAGWEVAVAFEGGDPDRPVVVGRVYNAERTPPYALPGAKTSGAIRSASSPGGAGANEIKLGDSGGGQGFEITAQKDLNVTVGHDQNETVGVNDAAVVKVNAATTVGASQSITVGGDREVNVGSQCSAHVGGDVAIVVGGNAVDNATANHVEKVGGDRSSAVGGDMLVICNSIAHTIDGNIARDVGAVQLCASIASFSTTVGGNVTENVGVAKIDICKGGWGETVGGNKTAQILAAELDIVKGSYASATDAASTTLVGGLRLVKVAGDYTVTAPMITLLGATGTLKAGGSEVKLAGGPMVLKGSKISIETALFVKLGSSLKMGS